MKFWLPLIFLGLIDKKAFFSLDITKSLILTPI